MTPPLTTRKRVPMPQVSYADWKAPRTDGSMLLWPGGAELVEHTLGNVRALSETEVKVAGVPLIEAREATRRYLGHDSEAPLIVTGHQCELHHPGVWIKNVVIHHLAERVRGRAMHLAVDTDQPKHLQLKYPLRFPVSAPAAGGGEGFEIPITDDDALATAPWTGRLAAPSPAHATSLERHFLTHARQFGFEPVLPGFLAGLRRASLEEQLLPRVMVNLLHELDWSLGLRYDAILASPLWGSEYFLLFACHLISRAGEYAGAYNAALAEYRREEGIENPGRPMPDLEFHAEMLELPFWLDDDSAGTRTRAHARVTPAGYSITLNGERFTFTPDAGWDGAIELQRFLRRHNHRLSPRALTLTTFCRLLFADLFVHGIGGGRYDQVTDKTLATFFGLPEVPRFAVSTGTLYFPWAMGRVRACVACVIQEGHHLRHNLPDLNKSDYLRVIAESPRKSTGRKQVYLQMHRELARSREASPALVEWNTRLATTLESAREDRLVFDRELFYALQPRNRLESWIDRMPSQMG